MLKRCVIILLLSWSLFLHAQESPRAARLYGEGYRNFRIMEYETAIRYLNEAIRVEPDFLQAYFILGEIYYEQNNYEEAIRVYERVISIDTVFLPEVFLYIAEMELKTGKYDASAGHSGRYISYPGRRPDFLRKAQKIYDNASFASQAVKNPVPFNPVNLGDSINTGLDEYWPSLTADEQMLVFTVLLPRQGELRPGDDRMHEDFYISMRQDSIWRKAVNAGPPLNTLRNEGAQSVTADGKYMFFTACNKPDGMGSCDIYLSRRLEHGWSTPVNLGYPVNTTAWEVQPSISPDGNTLFFVSNRKGGKGRMDIWMSHLQEDGSWTMPVNLGNNINTGDDENSPFIHPDNQTLYFSSNGHVGMGGLDIFRSKRINDTTWTQPVNLGYPINTNFDETGLIVNARGDMAYYASDRIPEKRRDIFQFELYPDARPVLVTYMKGTVFDKDTRRRLTARFELIDLKTSELVMEALADASGEFLVCIPSDRDYALNVSHEGYLFYSENFTLTGEHRMTDPVLKDIPLTPIRIGGVTVLKNIFFEFDSYLLLEESKVELDKLVEFLKENKSIRVEIGGHTDQQGTDEYNQVLSENRAREVYRYLVDRSITPGRLSYKGYGESQPVDTSLTPEGMARNRRTELKVTGMMK